MNRIDMEIKNTADDRAFCHNSCRAALRFRKPLKALYIKISISCYNNTKLGFNTWLFCGCGRPKKDGLPCLNQAANFISDVIPEKEFLRIAGQNVNSATGYTSFQNSQTEPKPARLR